MIVVFGSINIDIVMRVPRYPLAGETLLGSGCLLRPGGKGANQAVAAARVGASVRMFGAVGADPFGDEMRGNLTARGVDASGVRSVAGEMTGCATITVDDTGQNAICVAPGANLAVRADAVPEGVLGPTSIVMTQMEVPEVENWRVLERANRAGARVILNLAPAGALSSDALDAMKRWVDVLVVNETEARALGEHLAVSRPSHAENAAAIAEALGVTVVMTLGSDGACAVDGKDLFWSDAIPVGVVDTTGAGDTFVGVLAAALDRRAPLTEAMREASVAGSLSCQAVGAQEAMPDRATLVAALARQS